MKKHFKQQLETIAEAYKSLDDAASGKLLLNCLQTIRGGHKIVATALGKNVPICEKFVGTLNSLDIDAHFMHTNSAVHGDLGTVKDGDLVIVLSKSGETDETLYLCQLLKKRNVTKWLLTCSNDSTAGKIVENEIILKITKEGDPWNLVPNNSTLVFLVFLQALCMEIIDRLGIKLNIFKDNHPAGAIGEFLRKHAKP